MRLLPAFAIASFGFASIAAAQRAPACTPGESTRRTTERLQAIVDSLVRSAPEVPGISLSVVAPRLCLDWHGAAGVADRTTGARLTASHPTRIASNTKTYTAAAILRLMEMGKLSLSDPITRHIPAEDLASLRRDGYDLDRITIAHLLSHTGGVYDYAMDPHFAPIIFRDPTHRWTRAEQIDSAVVWGAPYNAPGAGYHYTDTGYILLGQVIERLSGKGLAEAFRSLLNFDALGLRATWLETLEPRPASTIDLAHQYLDSTDTRGIDPSFDLYGGGGLAATTGDMARFTRALFVGGVYARPTTIATMTTLPTGITGDRAYAFGIYRMDVGGDVAWGHTGFWNTFSFHIPSRDVTIAGSITQQGRSAVSRALLRLAAEAVPR